MLVEVTLFEDLLQLRVRVFARAQYRIYDRPNVSKDMPEDVSFILRLRGWRERMESDEAASAEAPGQDERGTQVELEGV